MAEHRLPHHPEAGALARRHAHDAVAGCLTGSRIDDFVLMVTELVTNAVRHAPPAPDGTVILRIEVDDKVARTVVIDGGTQFEFERATFDGATPHFGLQLVDRLSSRWGLSLDGEKAVWFEIDRER